MTQEKGLKLTFSGNEFHYTYSLILLLKNMLCSKLHRYKALILFPFHMILVFFFFITLKPRVG